MKPLTRRDVAMYAVEFETKAQDQLIEIPAQFTSLFSKPVRVIVMLKDNLANSINQQTEQLPAVKAFLALLPTTEKHGYLAVISCLTKPEVIG
jgi:Asp/Glu/hydantoin racemase